MAASIWATAPSLRRLTNKVPRVVIGPNAVVQGATKFEREVRLFVSNTARIGAVEGATAVQFTGERPPE